MGKVRVCPLPDGDQRCVTALQVVEKPIRKDLKEKGPRRSFKESVVVG